MMNPFQLELKCSLQPHPFPNEPGSGHDIWAGFEMNVRDSKGRLIRKVFNAQWDIREFLEWIIENKDFISREPIPIEAQDNDTSIAKIISDYINSIDVDTEDEELTDRLYWYRTRHGIWFGMRGTNAPNVYLGILNDIETISYYESKRANWAYAIALKDFVDQAVKIYEDAMSRRK